MAMKGKLLTALLCLICSEWSAASDFESAKDAVANMKVGWNLGNTLDSNSGDSLNMWIEHWTGRLPSDYEVAWGQPVTKPELFKMFKDAGFNAVRVPVTWYPHMEAEFNFSSWDNSIWYPSRDDIGTKIDDAWMARVHEVVDYVIDQGMYCILNVHHDTGAANTAWLVADNGIYEKEHARLEDVWRQIAEEFKDYDEHLLFEGYNEMLDIERSWCFASFNTSKNYDAKIAADAYKSINNYAQSFVDAVRSTGGNNSNRNLVVCTYGACDGGGSWSNHLIEPLKEMKLPSDKTEGHIIFEVHSYPSVKTLREGKTEIDKLIKDWNTHLVYKGAPMIVGEWSIKLDNRQDNCELYRYFVEKTKGNNIAVFHWMGLSDGESRSVPEFNESDLVDAIIKGYYGEGGYVSSIPSISINDNDCVDVYSLSGIMLHRNVLRNGVKHLVKPGLYIVGGKIMYIK